MRSLSSRTMRIVFSIFLVVVVCASVFTPSRGQKGHEPSCTTLTLRIPKYKVALNDLTTVTADISGAKHLLGTEAARLLSFDWTLTSAAIVHGQGTREIVFQSANVVRGRRHDVTINLEVRGLPPECASRISSTLTLDPNCATPKKIQEYGEISFEDETKHLNVLAEQLKSIASGHIAYIVVYGGQTSCISEATWRADRIKRYLTTKLDLPADKIELVDGGFRTMPTVEVFLAENSACGPMPKSTLAMDDVNIHGPCS